LTKYDYAFVTSNPFLSGKSTAALTERLKIFKHNRILSDTGGPSQLDP